MMEFAFWAAVGGVIYAYFGYPLLLAAIGRLVGRRRLPLADETQPPPTVSMIVPIHNEEARIARKVANTAALRYPSGRLRVIFVSDGSTDRTVEIVRSLLTADMEVVELPRRQGKAAALNAGLARATNDVVVFSDAAIALQPDALLRVVGPFADPKVGCVSGEDRIGEAAGEGLYGRYELFLRRLESRVHSIVGASGSFYAQRRALCDRFPEGMAPDFLSVVRTVERGYRAVAEPEAIGSMTSVQEPRHEFERKVRTAIRGMTTLFAHARLLNPVRHGLFAFALFSHKVMRWAVPFFLLIALVSPLWLLDSPLYLAAFVAQVAFYGVALLAFRGWCHLHVWMPGRVALYFSSVNAAILAAWIQYGRGVRQEIWTPSAR